MAYSYKTSKKKPAPKFRGSFSGGTATTPTTPKYSGGSGSPGTAAPIPPSSAGGTAAPLQPDKPTDPEKIAQAVTQLRGNINVEPEQSVRQDTAQGRANLLYASSQYATPPKREEPAPVLERPGSGAVLQARGTYTKKYQATTSKEFEQKKELARVEDKDAFQKIRAQVFVQTERGLETARQYVGKVPAVSAPAEFAIGAASGASQVVKSVAYPGKTVKETYEFGKAAVTQPRKTFEAVGVQIGKDIETKGIFYTAGEYYGYQKASGAAAKAALKIGSKAASVAKSYTPSSLKAQGVTPLSESKAGVLRNVGKRRPSKATLRARSTGQYQQPPKGTPKVQEYQLRQRGQPVTNVREITRQLPNKQGKVTVVETTPQIKNRKGKIRPGETSRELTVVEKSLSERRIYKSTGQVIVEPIAGTPRSKGRIIRGQFGDVTVSSKPPTPPTRPKGPKVIDVGTSITRGQTTQQVVIKSGGRTLVIERVKGKVKPASVGVSSKPSRLPPSLRDQLQKAGMSEKEYLKRISAERAAEQQTIQASQRGGFRKGMREKLFTKLKQKQENLRQNRQVQPTYQYQQPVQERPTSVKPDIAPTPFGTLGKLASRKKGRITYQTVYTEEYARTPPALDDVTKSKVSLKPETVVGNVAYVASKYKPATATVSRTIPSTTPALRQELRPIQTPSVSQTPTQTPAQTPATGQKPAEITKQDTPQVQERTSRGGSGPSGPSFSPPSQPSPSSPTFTPPSATPPRRPSLRPPTPPTTRKPEPKLLPLRKAGEANRGTAGFDVFIRRRGKFIRKTFKPLSRPEALAFGAEQVRSTAAATFKLQPSFGKATGRYRGPPARLGGFKQKGSLFIQPSRRSSYFPGARLSTRGEIRDVRIGKKKRLRFF